MVRRELESNNLELLRNKVNRYVQSFILLIERLLEGSIIGSPDTFGETLQEEKAASGIGEWPAHGIEYDIQNSHYKIYGGAQYERLLNEFEYVAHSKGAHLRPHRSTTSRFDRCGAAHLGWSSSFSF